MTALILVFPDGLSRFRNMGAAHPAATWRTQMLTSTPEYARHFYVCIYRLAHAIRTHIYRRPVDMRTSLAHVTGRTYVRHSTSIKGVTASELEREHFLLLLLSLREPPLACFARRLLYASSLHCHAATLSASLYATVIFASLR